MVKFTPASSLFILLSWNRDKYTEAELEILTSHWVTLYKMVNWSERKGLDQNSFVLTTCGQLLDTNTFLMVNHSGKTTLPTWRDESILCLHITGKELILIWILGHFGTSSLSQKWLPFLLVVTITTTTDRSRKQHQGDCQRAIVWKLDKQ